MTVDAVFLLPLPNPEHVPLEPVTHLLGALEHIAKKMCKAAKDANERQELLYYTAVASLANTYSDEQQAAVYECYATRYSSLNATQQRVATLALYGLASDRAVKGVRPRNGHTWAAAAIAALEHYRTRRTDRTTTSISGQAA